MVPMNPDRQLGDVGQCEADDVVSTTNGEVSVRCTQYGRVISERLMNGGLRWRCVCSWHGYDSAMDTQ